MSGCDLPRAMSATTARPRGEPLWVSTNSARFRSLGDAPLERNFSSMGTACSALLVRSAFSAMSFSSSLDARSGAGGRPESWRISSSRLSASLMYLLCGAVLRSWPSVASTTSAVIHPVLIKFTSGNVGTDRRLRGLLLLLPHLRLDHAHPEEQPARFD